MRGPATGTCVQQTARQAGAWEPHSGKGGSGMPDGGRGWGELEMGSVEVGHLP